MNLAPKNLQILLWFMALIAIFTVFYPLQTHEYWDAWINSHSYSHGLLLLLVSLFLIGSKPYAVAGSGGNLGFLLLLAGLVLVYALASLAKIEVILRFLMPCFMIAATGAVFGYHNLKKFLIPLLLLFFTVPSWSIVSPIFQAIAANAVATISMLIGIPTYIEGNSVAIPNGTFLVAEGCSGVRYILVALSIALINSELSQFKTRSQVISLGLAFLLAIVANWVRIEIIVLYAHQYGMSHPIIADHNSLGWIVFAVFMLFYFLLLPYITTQENKEQAITPAPLQSRQKWLGLASIAVLAMGAAMPAYFYQQAPQAAAVQEQSRPAAMHNFAPATREQHKQEQLQGSRHSLSVLEYDMRDPGADITNQLNRPVNKQYRIKEVLDDRIADHALKTFILTDNSKQYLYSFWYQTGDLLTTSLTRVKLGSVVSLLQGDFINRAYFVATECETGCNNLAAHKGYIQQLMTKTP
ncbi:exosortase [Thalassomonas viridans]|uniref:Exosortase n=1 Tax=Thalassomonas viridans TaxID=137584 RepID=A0AAE9Z1T9_9GAMM|nr:exosortase [Thalassomonas viridans]WDE05013.1 exosortase [Thalassomonas viridans]